VHFSHNLNKDLFLFAANGELPTPSRHVWWLLLNGFFSSIDFEKNNIDLYDLIDKPGMHGGAVIQQKSEEEK
jgi:hypothetical protein